MVRRTEGVVALLTGVERRGTFDGAGEYNGVPSIRALGRFRVSVIPAARFLKVGDVVEVEVEDNVGVRRGRCRSSIRSVSVVDDADGRCGGTRISGRG